MVYFAPEKRNKGEEEFKPRRGGMSVAKIDLPPSFSCGTEGLGGISKEVSLEQTMIFV